MSSGCSLYREKATQTVWQRRGPGPGLSLPTRLLRTRTRGEATWPSAAAASRPLRSTGPPRRREQRRPLRLCREEKPRILSLKRWKAQLQNPPSASFPSNPRLGFSHLDLETGGLGCRATPMAGGGAGGRRGARPCAVAPPRPQGLRTVEGDALTTSSPSFRPTWLATPRGRVSLRPQGRGGAQDPWPPGGRSQAPAGKALLWQPRWSVLLRPAHWEPAWRTMAHPSRLRPRPGSAARETGDTKGTFGGQHGVCTILEPPSPPLPSRWQENSLPRDRMWPTPFPPPPSGSLPAFITFTASSSLSPGWKLPFWSCIRWLFEPRKCHEDRYPVS